LLRQFRRSSRFFGDDAAGFHWSEASNTRRLFDRQFAMPVDHLRAARYANFNLVRTSAIHVRRDKAALFQWVQGPPGDRSSRKHPEQAWRRRNV